MLWYNGTCGRGKDATYQAEKKKVNELASAKKNIDRYLAQDNMKTKQKTKDELD